MICNEEVPKANTNFRQYLALGVGKVWNPWLDEHKSSFILSLNPGIVEYHPAYFSHCSHTFLVILVRRICLMMKALVPWSQKFLLKFLFVEEGASCKAERETRFFLLSSPLRCSLFPSFTRIRSYVLTWFDHSLLSRNLMVNSVIMSVIYKWENSDYKKPGAKKIIFTACHSGKLKLAFTSPDIISTSPKNFLTSRIDFTVLLLYEFLKRHHFPIGQVKNRIQ